MIFGLIAFFFYLYFFVGLDQILVVVQNVRVTDYVIFYSLAIVMMILVIFFWVASWRHLLKELIIELNFKNAFLYYWAGYFVDLVVPCQAVCGELARLYLVQKETHENYGSIAAAGVTNRTISYSVATAGLGIGLIFITLNADVPLFVIDLLVFALVGSLIYLSILLYLIFSSDAAEKIVNLTFKVFKTLHIKSYSSGKTLTELLDSLKLFHESFKFFRSNPMRLIVPYGFQILAYGFNLVIYILVFYAVGINQLLLGFFVTVYFLTSTIQGTTASFSVGILEILLTSIFIFYGIDAAQSGVTAALLRSVIFWFPLVIGYIIIQIVGAKKVLNAAEKHNKS